MAESGDSLAGGGAATRLGYPLLDRILIVAGLPAAGVLLGLVLPVPARWLVGLSVPLPMGAVFRLLAAVTSGWELALAGGVGGLLGAVVAGLAITEDCVVTVTGQELRLESGGRLRRVPRADIDAVYRDRRHLVALDRDSRYLVREQLQAPRDALRAALLAHGYPWRDADPYADLYRRWTPGTGDLPAEVNAVLAARQTALRQKSAKQATDLGEVVAKLGFVIRDEGTRQYWRPVVRS